jgi:hypothetical protein
MTRPIALRDSQLSAVFAAARPLAVEERWLLARRCL